METGLWNQPNELLLNGKDEVFSVCTIKVHGMGGGGAGGSVDMLFLNFSSKWRWMTSFTLWPLRPLGTALWIGDCMCPRAVLYALEKWKLFTFDRKQTMIHVPCTLLHSYNTGSRWQKFQNVFGRTTCCSLYYFIAWKHIALNACF